MVFILNKENISEDYQLDYYRVLNKNINISNLISFLEDNKNINKDIKYINTQISLKMKNNLISFVDSVKNILLSKIKNIGNFYFLDSEIGQGIVGAPDKCFIINDPTLFTIEEQEFIKPFFTGIDRYKYEFQNKYLLYMSEKILVIKK